MLNENNDINFNENVSLAGETQNQVETATNNDNVSLNSDNENSKSNYPDGFDEETYDLKTSSVRYDKVKEKFENYDREIEKLQHQNLDLRKIVSKGKAPQDLKDYELNYKPDSRYEKYYNEDETTKETFRSFNELAKNTGLNLEQHKAIVDFMNETLVKAGVFDIRSKEEIEKQKNDWIKSEKEKLGLNADNMIKEDIEFINNFGGFNEEQREELKKFVGSGAIGVSIVNAVKRAIYGSGRNEDIPTNVNIGGLPDDITLAKEYRDEKTTNERRAEILQQRLRAGRTNPLL